MQANALPRFFFLPEVIRRVCQVDARCTIFPLLERSNFFFCHIMAVVIRHSRGAFFTALPYFRGNFHANVITFIQLLFSFSATQRPLPSVVASFQFVLSSKTITTTLTFTPGTSCFRNMSTFFLIFCPAELRLCQLRLKSP